MSDDNRPPNSFASRAQRETAAVRTTPVWSCSVTLNTDYAQRVYRRYYDKVRGDLFILTVRTRATGMDDAAGALETMLTEEFGALRKDLQDELGRTEALMEKVKLDRVPTYEGAQTLQAQYSTPRAKEYLDVIVQMDQLLMNYDALWLTGYIETRDRVNRSQNWQRRLIKSANRVRELGNRTKGGIQREIDRRAQRTRRDGPGDPAQVGAQEGSTPNVDSGDTALAADTDAAADADHVDVEEEGAGLEGDELDLTDASSEAHSVSSDGVDVSVHSSDTVEGAASELHADDEPNTERSAPSSTSEEAAEVPADARRSTSSSAPPRRARRGNSAAAPAGEPIG